MSWPATKALERIEHFLPGFTQRYRQTPRSQRTSWLLDQLADTLAILDTQDRCVELLASEAWLHGLDDDPVLCVAPDD